MLHDARQFGGESQAAPQVRFVFRSQRALDFGRKPAPEFGQVARRKRKNAMVLRQTQEFAPVDG
jgi:hypothetical protein